MRIISGSLKGRKLVKIYGWQIRPTSDRSREAVFNILGYKVKNAKILDLFAGTGAMGLEALSRGAAQAVFIDLYCDIIDKNLNLCGFEKRACVISCDIVTHTIPESLSGQKFDLVFIDPPYGKGYIEDILKKKIFIDLLDDDCIIVAEHSCRGNLQIDVPGLDIYRQKKYSKTIISFMKKI